MKKLYICFIVLLFLFSLDFKEDVIPTFNYQDDTYSVFELIFENKIVNTNNFNNYFNELKILTIEPFINEIYASKINFKEYKFNQLSNYNNISKFNKLFINFLDSNGYKSDALYNSINGTYIKKVTLYCSVDDINILKNKVNFNFRQI